MTVTATSNNGWTMGPGDTQLHPGKKVSMQANAPAGYGQAIFYNSSGHAALNDGATPGLLCAGVVLEKLLSSDSIAGNVSALVHRGLGSGQPASTIANDSFLTSDVLAVAYDAGNGVPGKLSNYSGSNRSILGLCLGLDAGGNPNIWAGPEAAALARSWLISQAFPLASHSIADAAASTTTAERTIRRPRVKGTVTSITFNGAAIAANDTDYVTITVAKRDGAGGGAVTLGTYDSRVANQGAATAFVDVAFSLSAVAGALYLLETDIVTVTIAKGGSGKTITGEVLVNGKVG